MNFNFSRIFFPLLCGCVLWSCSDYEAFHSFVVDTTESGLSKGHGLSVQIGVPGQEESLVASTVNEEGKVIFDVDLSRYVNQTVWVCIPGVVKYFHVLTQEEVNAGLLVLPDKDGGSTLLTVSGSPQAGGKYYVNDWIVSYYMGINRGGNSDIPVYWASGNLIATKINAEDSEESEVAYHIATMDETKAEAVDGVFLGMDSRLKANVPDAYVALPAGTQWDLFSFGDGSGKMLYADSELERYVVDSGQMQGDEIVYDTNSSHGCDIARVQLGGSWRTPSGGKGQFNELAALEDDAEGYQDMKPDAVEWLEDGVKLGYKYEYSVEVNGEVITTNTLYFPAAGYRHSTDFAGGRGVSGWYWSSTADPTCTTPYVPNGTYEGEVTERTTAFNYGFLQGKLQWFPHPRTSIQAIRPVTE